jgi:hypothetical protein
MCDEFKRSTVRNGIAVALQAAAQSFRLGLQLLYSRNFASAMYHGIALSVASG